MLAVVVDPKKLVAAQGGDGHGKALLIVEALTLAILLTIIFWSVGPLLEEWGLIHAFKTTGFEYFAAFAPSIPMRPLHLVAYSLQWLLGNGHPFGVAAGTAVILVIRYFVVRWAVSPLLAGYERWVICTLGATLAFWPGAMLGRYGSAQLSAVFLFLALGFAVRLHRKWSFMHAVGAAVSGFLVLSTYQGLTLCVVALPVASMFWRRGDESRLFAAPREILSGAVRVAGPIVLGFLLYGIYGYVVTRILGSAGYEGVLAGDSARLLTLNGLTTHIAAAYTTAFFKSTYLLPAMLGIAFLISQPGLARLEVIRSRYIGFVLVFILILCLPLLAMIYVNAAHIKDIDRVLYPVAGGFVLVCMSLLALLTPVRSNSYFATASSAVVVLLMSSLLLAISAHGLVKLQKTVLRQIWQAAELHEVKSVLVKDQTGVLGDVYTLYDSVLNEALAMLGHDVKATICTPDGVDRIHPVAQRFPLPSTERCESLRPPAGPTVVLNARWVDSKMVLPP